MASKGVLRGIFFSGVAALMLAGCSTGLRTEVPSLICPAIGIVQTTSTITRFRPGGNYLDSDVQFQAQLSRLQTSCEESGGDVVSQIAFTVSASKGQALSGNSITLPYFVAVTTQSGEIVSKQLFEATLNFGENGRAETRERVRQHLAVDDAQEIREHEILIGFQLTDDDLVYNLSR